MMALDKRLPCREAGENPGAEQQDRADARLLHLVDLSLQHRLNPLARYDDRFPVGHAGGQYVFARTGGQMGLNVLLRHTVQYSCLHQFRPTGEMRLQHGSRIGAGGLPNRDHSQTFHGDHLPWKK
jgi:hypothetical protein